MTRTVPHGTGTPDCSPEAPGMPSRGRNGHFGSRQCTGQLVVRHGGWHARSCAGCGLAATHAKAADSKFRACMHVLGGRRDHAPRVYSPIYSLYIYAYGAPTTPARGWRWRPRWAHMWWCAAMYVVAGRGQPGVLPQRGAAVGSLRRGCPHPQLRPCPRAPRLAAWGFWQLAGDETAQRGARRKRRRNNRTPHSRGWARRSARARSTRSWRQLWPCELLSQKPPRCGAAPAAGRCGPANAHPGDHDHGIRLCSYAVATKKRGGKPHSPRERKLGFLDLENCELTLWLLAPS
jgi:hypothetical protein